MGDTYRPTAKDLKRLDELIFKLSNTLEIDALGLRELRFMQLIEQLEEEE